MIFGILHKYNISSTANSAAGMQITWIILHLCKHIKKKPVEKCDAQLFIFGIVVRFLSWYHADVQAKELMDTVTIQDVCNVNSKPLSIGTEYICIVHYSTRVLTSF